MRAPGRFCRKHDVSWDSALPFHLSMVSAQIVPVQWTPPLNVSEPFCTKMAPARTLLLLNVIPPVPFDALFTTRMIVLGVLVHSPFQVYGSSSLCRPTLPDAGRSKKITACGLTAGSGGVQVSVVQYCPIAWACERRFASSSSFSARP